MPSELVASPKPMPFPSSLPFHPASISPLASQYSENDIKKDSNN
jgi:hypothetical protein